MIKMFAIDLDGTMYTSQRTITSKVRQAILNGMQLGLQPIIVTGRGRRGAELALDTLEMDLPYICSAGALVRPGLTGKTIHTWTFHAHDELKKVINFSRQHGSGMIAEPEQTNPFWFGPDAMNEIMDPLTVKEAQRSIRTFEPEKDFDRPMLKVTLTAAPEVLVEAEILLREKCPSIHQVFSGIHYIDLTAKGVNKGAALQALAKHYGVIPEEIAAIGDQDIDIQMLLYAGLPIAMANGIQAVRHVAKWIAPSNDDDGVAWAIDEILKLNR